MEAKNTSCQQDLRSQEKNFELIDSLYFEVAEGDIDKFKKHANQLDKLLTPNENTILHIHITARPPTANGNSSWKLGLSTKSGGVSQRKDFVREVLKMCPDLLWKANTTGETPLHIAARHGHADIVNVLIDECKRSHQKDQENGVGAVRQMLEKTNEAKDSALHEAVRYNYVEVVKILIKEDPTLPYDANDAGETPLYLAAERGYKDVVKEILSTCKLPADHGPLHRTALHAAILFADFDITKMLLDNKATSTREADHKGWLPLHYAAYEGYVRILKELLKTDKSAAYKTDKEGKTALHVAAGRGKYEAMKEIISSCPSCCELVDNKGWNVVHCALDSGHRMAVEFLLENPSFANLINQKDKEGNTPLLQLAVSRSFMHSFVSHHRVDKLAFNHQNENVWDIIDRDDPFSRPHSQVLFANLLNNIVAYGWCPRVTFPEDKDDEGKDKSNSTVGTKSDDMTKKGKTEDGWFAYIKEAKDSRLIVAILIATVTFAAGITLPGGYISEKGPEQGAAVLIRNTAFHVFVISNTIAMIFSSSAVFIHFIMPWFIYRKELDCRLWSLSNLLIIYAMVAMVLAFVTGTYAVLHHSKDLAISIWIIGSLFFLGLSAGQLFETYIYAGSIIKSMILDLYWHYWKVRREL